MGILQRVVTGIKQRLRSPAPLLQGAWVEEGKAELPMGPDTAPTASQDCSIPVFPAVGYAEASASLLHSQTSCGLRESISLATGA